MRQRAANRPDVRPDDPRFSSGPCKKHPGWSLAALNTRYLGRSHRSPEPKARLADAIHRSHQLLALPDDWRVGIVPGSDTGAFEMAMWSLLGARAIDVLVWENFSREWANDLKKLSLDNVVVHEAVYGELPNLDTVSASNDVVMVFNGTTSGVRLPHLDWLSQARDGLVLCDATSAAFAMPIDYSRLDVLTWSWQKVLGGEAAHGMLALSPRAVARLENIPATRPLPKVFSLTRQGKLIEGIFEGSTINTPSLLAVEDLHSALDWAEQIGGLAALHQRCKDNFDMLDRWVQQTSWVDWLAKEPATRSPSSMCLKLTAPSFTALDAELQQHCIHSMVDSLATESVAFDIANYVSAPPGFRIWGGATVEASDIAKLTPWLDWVYHDVMRQLE